jgi:flagellar FliJ protein
MAKFVFTLKSLLRARQIAEQGCQRAVAELEQQRLALEGRLRNEQSRIVQMKGDLRNTLTGPIDPHALRLHAAATMQQVRSAQQMVLEMAGVHRRLEPARLRLVEAARQRRAVELLRDQRFEQWKRIQDRKDTALLDELATIASARQPGNASEGTHIAGG